MALFVWLAGIFLFFYLLYSIMLAALNNSQLNQTLRELLRHMRDSDHARKAETLNPGAGGVSAPSETCPACDNPVSPVYHWCPSCGLKLQDEP